MTFRMVLARSVLVSGGLLLAACVAASDGRGGPRSAAGPAGADDAGAAEPCGLAPREGCPCEGRGSVECRLDPVVRDGAIRCPVGQRFCREGLWSGCEGVHEEPPPGGRDGAAAEALVVGPVQCSACEPRCFYHEDEPGPADLPGRSRDLWFDPRSGGVILDRTVEACMSAACTSTTSTGVGSGTPWMPTPANSDGVVVDPMDGALTLGASGTNSYGVWVASMNDGTVSRLDPRTGREIARYPSVGNVAGLRPWNEACNWSDRGNCPSRTAVDQNFDAYVANRAFGSQGSVTKYAGRITDCRDRNGNGVIDTSRDINGDGRISMATVGIGQEFVGPQDECILWTVPVGPWNGVPRALAVGTAPPGVSAGDVWVGLFNTQTACRLNPNTGANLGCLSIWPVYPYGAVADPRGRIWFTSRAWSRSTLVHVDPASMRAFAAPLAPTEIVSYGIAVWSDPTLTQTYVFVADSNQNAINRYNPTTGTWYRRDLATLGLWITPRGIAADANDSLWIANWSTSSGWGGSCSRELFELRIPDLRLRNRYAAPSANCYTGVGVAFDNAIWAVAYGNNRAARLAPDRRSWIETPSIFVAPYTYSDFIGFGLNFFANPRGNYTYSIDTGPGCARYRWSTLTWSATTPPGTTVELWVRAADTTAALGAAPWIGPFATSPADLASRGIVGRYLEVDIRMTTADRRTTPRVYSVSATGMCDAYRYDPTGSYVQTYDATSRCASNEQPAWGDLTFRVATPPGTYVDFEIRSAPSAAGLAGATPAVVRVPTATSPVNIESQLRAAGIPLGQPYLSVTAVLRASADLRLSPTLYEFGVEYTCVPAE